MQSKLDNDQETSQASEPTLSILLADDDKDSREYLKILLMNGGHQVIEAENGQQAIDAFKTHNPDIIFMDVIMPEVDGYDATRTIKSLAQQTHVPVIFITSLTDDESLLKCIEAGGDDFLTKPYNAILFYAKLNAHARIRHLTQGLKKKNELLDFFRRNTEREHRIAERVFGKRISLGQLDSPYLNFHFSSMAIFNGDIYQAITADNGDLYVLLGDFTGHGLAAATGTLPVSDAFISQANEKQSIGEIATTLNGLLKEILPADMFCAASIMRYTPSTLSLEVWSGGLPCALGINKTSKEIKVYESKHLPLGILPSSAFDDSTHTIELAPEESLYVYTDGITETMNEDEEMFGEDRLKDAIIEYCDQNNSIDAILKGVQEYSSDDDQQDDISIIELSAQTID